MRKIDVILENIRDEYMINLLEESEVSELQALKTKKFLNESLGRIRKSLIEEGNMDAVKEHLKNNWGKYLAGAGAGAAGAAAYHYAPEIQDALQDMQRGRTMDDIMQKANQTAAENDELRANSLPGTVPSSDEQLARERMVTAMNGGVPDAGPDQGQALKDASHNVWERKAENYLNTPDNSMDYDDQGNLIPVNTDAEAQAKLREAAANRAARGV